jgi:hypothetical protein
LKDKRGFREMIYTAYSDRVANMDRMNEDMAKKGFMYEKTKGFLGREKNKKFTGNIVPLNKKFSVDKDNPNKPVRVMPINPR